MWYYLMNSGLQKSKKKYQLVDEWSSYFYSELIISQDLARSQSSMSNVKLNKKIIPTHMRETAI